MIPFPELFDESGFLVLIDFGLPNLPESTVRFVVLRMCFIVFPQVVGNVVPRMGECVVPQVGDGIDVFPQVVDVVVGRKYSCNSCG